MRINFLQLAIVWVFALGGWSHCARGNVYATHLRLNGSTNNAVVCPGHGVSVDYILNEPASGGVLLEVLNGTNVLQSTNVAAGEPGTLRGCNSLSWNGKNTNDAFVDEGLYSVRITASAVGYDSWTQISNDTNSGNKLQDPYSIAVNQNTNSPYYGRVFVGNSLSKAVSGQEMGIYKFNADCSPAEDGPFCAPGGYNAWSGYVGFEYPAISPWKMEVSQDDHLFVNDWGGFGIVLRFDQVESAPYSTFLDYSHHPFTNDLISNLSGPAITGSGTNTQIWMADARDCSFGILRWSVGSDGALAPNDVGTTVVAAGTNSDLSTAPWDVAVDKNGKIYTIQNPIAGIPAVLCFPAFGQSGEPETLSTWKNGGQNDDFAGGTYGIAVNPEASYVAVAVLGTDLQIGGVVILNATNGAFITNLNDGVFGSFLDVAWDNVGNVYGAEHFVWHVFSPPGTNQATTVAVENVQVLNTIERPTISDPHPADGQFQFTLTGQSSVPYIIASSTNLVDWDPVATNYSASAVRNIQVSNAEDMRFYRAIANP